MTVYACCDQNRRSLVLRRDAQRHRLDRRAGPRSATHGAAPAHSARRLRQLAGAARADRRQRRRSPAAIASPACASRRSATTATVLVVHLDAYGDFSPYVLSSSPTGADPPLPVSIRGCLRSSSVSRSECPTDIDCAPVAGCPPPAAPAPPRSTIWRRIIQRFATDARPHERDRAGLDRAQRGRPRRDAWSRRSPMSPII